MYLKIEYGWNIWMILADLEVYICDRSICDTHVTALSQIYAIVFLIQTISFTLIDVLAGT